MTMNKIKSNLPILVYLRNYGAKTDNHYKDISLRSISDIVEEKKRENKVCLQSGQAN
jgi:hypothetical protein